MKLWLAGHGPRMLQLTGRYWEMLRDEDQLAMRRFQAVTGAGLAARADSVAEIGRRQRIG